MKIVGFNDLQCIHEGRRVVIYRGKEEGPLGKSVILKTLKSEFPTISELASLKREYQLLSQLKIDNVIQAQALKQNQHSLILVLEDIGGIPLKEFLAEKPINNELFLKIAIQLTKALGSLHHSQIIHKDIKSNNIIIQPKDHLVKITDFSISSQLSKEEQEILNPNIVEGTLQYISPEQTGRMNRCVDYRTDFYSLGIVFYEMLSGHVPFLTEDILEIIHSHIAKTPPPLRADVPKQIQRIVYKMLSKAPEDRYSSALGIQADLSKCLKSYLATGAVDPFELGAEDFPEHLNITQKLYGRECEIQFLLEAFRRVNQGATEALFIAGYSGVGKSSLVAEVHRPITRQFATFISGKFDQLQKATPYSAFIQAFQEWIRQRLAEPEKKLEEMRSQLISSLGNNAKVIAEMIPEFELIVGTLPPLPILEPTESQNRFMITLQNFVRTLAQPEAPLVIFLDDLQWADLGSLRLIEWLLTDPGMHNFLFIGAYRDNEVDANHPLYFALQGLKRLGVKEQSITLKPLKLEDIRCLLMDSLRINESKAEPFATLLFKKTGGNPFFVNEFLKMLFADGLLKISFENHTWNWDLEKISALETTDNVVDLMIGNIKKLPPNAQELLKMAACIGNNFDLHTLALVSGKSLQYIVDTLWKVLQEGFVIPLNANYKILTQIQESDLEKEKIDYKFLHDRVQQAAYQLIPESKKQEVHLLIGRLLIEEPNGVTDKLFDLLDHFNKSLELIKEEKEKKQLSILNFQAGKRAKFATAYKSARLYFRSSITLLPKNAWQDTHSIAFELYKELVECEYLLGNIQEAEKLFDLLFKIAKTKLDKLGIYRIKVQMLNNLSQYQEGIKAGLEALKVMGVTIPENPSIFRLAYYFFKFKLFFNPKKLEKLKHELKPITDEEKKEIIRTTSSICSTAYAYNPKLFILLLFIQFELTLKYGYDEYFDTLAAPSLIFILANQLKAAHAYVDLSLYIYERDLNNISAVHDAAMGTYGTHWSKPFTVTIDYLDRSFGKSLEAGDFVYANYCRTVKVFALLEETGKTLSEIIPEADKYLEFTKRSKDQNHELQTYMQLLFLHYIHGDCPEMTHEAYKDAMSQMMSKAIGPLIMSMGYIFQGQAAYLLGNYEEALKAWENFYAYHQNHLVGGYIAKCYLFYALSLGACYPQMRKKEQRFAMKRLKKLHKQLKIWSNVCPTNYLHKTLLIAAEIERAHGNYIEAIELYTQAFDETQTLGVIQYAAVAQERLAQLFIEYKQPRVARTYLQEAHYGYSRWCAFKKVKALEEIYPDWLKVNKQQLSSGDTTTLDVTSTSTTSVDFLSILKSSQAISSEIMLDSLLKSLLISVIENAGAQRGALFIEQQQRLLLIAEGEIGQEMMISARGVPLDDKFDLPKSVISYALRSHENVVLQDAMKAEKFQQDPYIASVQPKSLLCVPFLHQNRISGYIYLENRLTTGAFTEERLKVLQLLAGQAAISLDNARLYAACGRFVPYEFLEQIKKKNLIEVQLGDQIQREMTVLFCDIRGFTTLSEKMTPSEVFKLINSFLGCMGPVVKKNNGFIDKYIGDAIMALFISPDDAVKAAADMLEELKKFNELFKTNVGIGIGINTGELMLGIIGEQDRLEGSVLGDAVNVASRIETLTRQVNADILISDATKDRLENPSDYIFTDVGQAPLKGKAKLVKIWRVRFSPPPIK